VQGEGALLDLSSLTLEVLRTAAATVSSSFTPKELELLQFGSEPYLIAYRPPTPDTVDRWSSRSGMDFITPTPDGESVLVSPMRPDRAFARFDEATMMRVARMAMPGVSIRDAVWLSDYDDYYYKTVSSFDLGLPRMAKTLPVLRVRYDDAADTWLYLTPAPGQIYKAERLDRANRWGYYGLHGPRLRAPISVPSTVGCRGDRVARRRWCIECHQHRAGVASPGTSRANAHARGFTSRRAPRRPLAPSRRQCLPVSSRTRSSSRRALPHPIAATG
jgi:hypothetical protein